ncbi:MAG: sensor histidine kinase N-terminal domain-containing protein [Chromatiaceae bacterium]|nr:sensor histidine kinase N-terminal domain-containing protein [Chromatiaceae bacterium]
MTYHPSIRRRLLGMLILAILAVWLAALLLVYQAAEHEVEEVFDADLARSARILQTILLHERFRSSRRRRRRARRYTNSAPTGWQPIRPCRLLRQYFDAGASRALLEFGSASSTTNTRYGTGLAFVARALR